MITKKLFCWTRLCVIIRAVIPLFLFCISVVSLNAYNPSLLNFITATIKHHQITFCLIRWAALLISIAIWPYLAVEIGKRYNATPDQITQWKLERWRIGIWLILVELLVCENLIGHTIQLLGAN